MSEEKKPEKLAGRYRFDGEEKCRLDKLPTDSKSDGVDKEKILKRYEKNLARMGELQEKLYEGGFFAALQTEEGYVSFCVTEKHGKEEADALVELVKEVRK